MRSPTQLLKDAYALVRSHLALFVGIAAIPMVLTYILNMFEPAAGTGVVMAEEWLVFFPLMIVVTIVTIVMTIALILALSNPSLKVMEAYKQSFKYFWRYLGLSILMSIAIMVGFLLLVIPGLILSVWFAFASYILVLENAAIIDSLKRSREYVRGRWWGVFGRLIVMSLVAFLLSALAGFVSSILPMSLGGLVEAIVSVLMMPYLVAFMYLMYQDVKGGTAATASV